MAGLYLRDDLRADARVGAVLDLSGDEARHAVTVGRVRLGETIAIGDGRGAIARGPVVSTGQRELTIEVEELEAHERRTPAITLVQALAKGDRDERAVQAATELGVDVVVPWAAARSVSRWEGPKALKGRERWRSIVREASKQSLRAWLPEVAELATTRQLAALVPGARILVLEPAAPHPITALSFDVRDVVLVVGPEGGVAPEELTLLEEAGADLVRLGPEVLRTSTAGPAAIALLSAALGRW